VAGLTVRVKVHVPASPLVSVSVPLTVWVPGASEVAALIADDAWSWLDAPVKRLGGLDVPSMPYAIPMEDYFMPTPKKITKALRDLAAY